MNHWSARRKRFIFLLVLFALVLLIGVPAGFLFYDPPTCFDEKKNGDETDVDCGGSCQLLCSAQSLPLIPKGDPRVLEVAPGFYEVVAIVENPNVSGSLARARYTIRLFESVGLVPIKVIEGETFIPKSSTFAVFEGPFKLEGVVPTRATLEWDRGYLSWQRDESEKPNLSINNIVARGLSTEPRVLAELTNNSLGRVSHIELVALISDETGNLIAASRTIVDDIDSGESVPVIFSWPRPVRDAELEDRAAIDVVWRVFPDGSYFR